jgi:hypothetical protein
MHMLGNYPKEIFRAREITEKQALAYEGICGLLLSDPALAQAKLTQYFREQPELFDGVRELAIRASDQSADPTDATAAEAVLALCVQVYQEQRELTFAAKMVVK